MTRLIIFLTLVLMLTFCTNNTGQITRPTNYKIEVKMWGLLGGGDCLWTVSSDSITFKEMNHDSTITFSKALSSVERETIVDALSKVELDEIQNEYVDNSAPDDLGEYDFKISIDGQTKEIHVYQVKLESIFILVKKINRLLPDNHQIGYNEEYFRFKK